MKYLIFISLLLIVGCGPTPEYAESRLINVEGWTEDPVVFNMTIEDTEPRYELQLLIDHTTTYRYENIYFKIKTIFPDRDPREEQLSVNLADNKGKWQGDCSAESCTIKVYLLESFKFPSAGKYSFELRQYTREESLAGIENLELKLFKLKEAK